MDLLTSLHLSILKVLYDVDLAGSFWSILKPATPVALIRKPVLPEAGFKDFVSGLG
jgi:hypothetical protein